MGKQQVKILVIDDEAIKRAVMEDELKAAGFGVACAESPAEADTFLAKSAFDVIITDLRMPGKDGLTFLRELKARNADQAVIVMTAYGTVETAVDAMKLGAFDYIQKPFSTEELMLKLDKLLQYRSLASENEALRQELALQNEKTRLIGQSEAVQELWMRIRAVAGIDSTVLVEGESGTGKELVARIIHQHSTRAKAPFVAVSCAALPTELVESELFGHEAGAFTGAAKRRLGRFELADGGTLFLDDVDDVPVQVQVKLLRVLQESVVERIGAEQPTTVNVRMIAATKKSLLKLVSEGKYREDLYYRLNVVPIHLPPLRARLEDVPLLVAHFLETLSMKLACEKPAITPEAMAALQRHDWPGNVRELKHVVERMVVLRRNNVLDEADVPMFDSASPKPGVPPLDLQHASHVDLESTMADLERRLVQWAVDRANGNLAQAAQLLNIPRSTLQYKLNKLGDN